MQNQNRGDGYHGMYGDDRNEMYNSLKSGQYKKVNGGIGNREPFMKSSDIYSTYFQYPFNYDMYRPHPIAPPSEKRA